MPRGGAVDIPVKALTSTPGAHSAILEIDDPATAVVDQRVLLTVVLPQDLVAIECVHGLTERLRQPHRLLARRQRRRVDRDLGRQPAAAVERRADHRRHRPHDEVGVGAQVEALELGVGRRRLRSPRAGDEAQARLGEWVIDAHLPPAGTPTQPVEAGYWANAYVRMRHPDYDVLRGLLDDVGRSVHVNAG